MTPSILSKIDEAIENERPIKIRAYAVLKGTEEGLNQITEKILTKYDRQDLQGPVYTAIKELAMNGAKANIKRLLFEEKKIDMDDESEYEEGMDIFKSHLNEEWVLDYARKCKLADLYVDLVFIYNEKRLIMEAINNRPLSTKEDERIRQKFKKSMGYDNIAEFYMEGGDSSEGAGMGIVLVTMMLKAQGMDPHLFTIRSNYKDSTIAKVEFPFSEMYVPSRMRYSYGK